MILLDGRIRFARREDKAITVCGTLSDAAPTYILLQTSDERNNKNEKLATAAIILVGGLKAKMQAQKKSFAAKPRDPRSAAR